MGNPSNILFCDSDSPAPLQKITWLRVEGRGTFLNSVGLKEFVLSRIDQGQREFVIDLKLCPGMDSTFMGTLSGIGQRLKEIDQSVLHVINLKEQTQAELQELGVDEHCSMETRGLTPPNWVTAQPLPPPTDTQGKTGQAQTMLEAHENLVKAAPKNQKKFEAVIELLKQDLAKPE